MKIERIKVSIISEIILILRKIIPMKIFQCGNCKHAIYFENIKCESCGHLSGYRDTDREMLTFTSKEETLISDRENKEYKYCKNNEYNVCNWVLEKESV